MFGIPAEHIIPVANFIGLGILGLVAYFGQKYGRATTIKHETKQVEVAGALVDSTSINVLVSAITAQTHAIENQTVAIKRQSEHFENLLEAVKEHCDTNKKDGDKFRNLGYRFVETITSITGEVEELRRAAADIATQIARKM